MLDDTKAIDLTTDAGASGSVENRLLGALSPAELAHLPPLHRTGVAPGDILLEANTVPAEVLFPTAGTVLTLLALMPDRKPVETAQIGLEGATGALFGPQPEGFGFRVQVLIGGAVIRIPAARVAAAMEATSRLRAVVLRYAAAQLSQVQIGVACATLHAVEARAARWMLDLFARTGERSLPMTQEALADLLGVRRTTITRVVSTLEERGLVRHRRGRIIVMDAQGLEAAACPCHRRGRGPFEALAAS